MFLILAACDQPVPTAEPTKTPVPTAVFRPGQVIVDQRTVGDYEIFLWGPDNDVDEFVGGLGHFAVEHNGQPIMIIDKANRFPDVPATDLTGEGNPDIVLERNFTGTICCNETILLDFGPEPTEQLKITSNSSIGDWGIGKFADLNGDGSYEFITYDGIKVTCNDGSFPCFGGVVMVIFEYKPGFGFLPASPQFPEHYVEGIESQIGRLAEEYNQEGRVSLYSIYRLVASYLYMGRPEEAKDTFERYYTAKDVETNWLTLSEGIREGRFFTE